ncbi:MAG: transporter [Xanthomonadales bacterium]|nr:transporter [Xanthomonadales bacterium]
MFAFLALPRQGSAQTTETTSGSGPDTQFDRPGLSFASWSLPQGGLVWEQGLPDASWQRDGDTRTTQAEADSRLRMGLGHGVELQIAGTPYAWQSTRGATKSRVHGQGDTDVALKWTLPLSSQSWSLALLATHKFASGGQAFGSPGHADQLAAAVTRDLGSNRSLGGYLARDSQQQGRGWMSALSYGFPLTDALSGYVETGLGNGIDRARVAGGGLTMLLHHRVQLDGWVLRGLDRGSPDWQAGFGVSVVLARGH